MGIHHSRENIKLNQGSLWDETIKEPCEMIKCKRKDKCTFNLLQLKSII